MRKKQDKRNSICAQSRKLSPLAVIVVIVYSIFLCACGVGAGSSSQGSTGSGSTGSLSASSTSLNLGTVKIGSSASQNLTITDTGTAAISITGITISGSGFAVSGLTTPVALNPSQAVTASIKFSPTVAGTANATVTVATDTTGKNLTISLTGLGQSNVTAQLTATPSSVSFGTVAVGSTNSKSVTLSSSGTGNVSLGSASFSGPGFNVSGLATPITLAPGSSSQFTVGFNPSSVGAANGSVVIKDGSGGTLLTIALSGTAVAAAAHSVELAWTASSSPVVGYRVYRGLASGGPYNLLSGSLIPAPSYTDQTVAAGNTYFFVVTAVDSANAESGFSNEVRAAIPFP